MKSGVTTLRVGIYAAAALIAGIVLSGPTGLIVVQAVHAQPAWKDAATLAANYHPIQAFPFFGGFILVAGADLLVATLYQLADEEHKAQAMMAVICSAAFTALIFFNYICQTTFLPALLQDYSPANDAIISALAFTNPRSLCWAIEMWGYALLGVATWLLAPVFSGSAVEKTASWLQVANGIISIAGGFITAMNLSWVFTIAGLSFYALWNVLVLVWGVFAIISLRGRERQGQGQIAATA